jgi:predicted DNA-binding protein (MmcQ/YjbR family)
MKADAIREYCLKKKGRITEGFPFGEGVLVFKVNAKVFLLLLLDAHPLTMNLKCDPGLAIELRERYESVRPGYHMNKTHWNTIVLDGTIPQQEIKQMIDHSYEQIVLGMKKSERQKLLPATRQEDEQKGELSATRARARTQKPK